MSNKKNKAQRLADVQAWLRQELSTKDRLATSAELHQLDAVNRELLEALRGALEHWPIPSSICKDRQAYEVARAAIAKATDV